MNVLKGRQPFEIERKDRYEGGNEIPSRFSVLIISLSVAGGRPHHPVESACCGTLPLNTFDCSRIEFRRERICIHSSLAAVLIGLPPHRIAGQPLGQRKTILAYCPASTAPLQAQVPLTPPHLLRLWKHTGIHHRSFQSRHICQVGMPHSDWTSAVGCLARDK